MLRPAQVSGLLLPLFKLGLFLSSSLQLPDAQAHQDRQKEAGEHQQAPIKVPLAMRTIGWIRHALL